MPIAKGGMGQVWAARMHGTRGFQRLVALKTLLPSHEDAGQLESMLFEEASLASLVRHPNVVGTLDLGERKDGMLYLVMEWVEGEPLDYVLRMAEPAGVPLPIVVHFVLQALRGLRAVHEACNTKGEPLGIVHRDISLQNLLVTYEGIVKLIDFGIAKATQQMSPPTADGIVKGKFAYMAPEQLRGETPDARADLFSTGIVLYRVTTGAHPFKSQNPAATIRKILLDEPRRPSELVRGYPQALEDVVLRALAKDKAARFGSAHEMALALEHALPEAPRGRGEEGGETFLRRLFASRMADRTQALQAALKAADEGWGRGTSEPPLRFPRSHPTMRAVSLETIVDDPGGGETGSSTPNLPAPEPVARRGARSSRWVAGALTAGVGLLLAVGSVRVHTRSSPAAGLSSIAPPPAPPVAPVSSSPPVAAGPPATATEPATETSGPPPAPSTAVDANLADSPQRALPPKKRGPISPRGAGGSPTDPARPAPAATADGGALKSAPPPAPFADPLSRRK